jgi:putative tricarboxylic transport membrane protein
VKPDTAKRSNIKTATIHCGAPNPVGSRNDTCQHGDSNVKYLNQDHIIGFICILLAVVILSITASFPKVTTGASNVTGPSFFPNLLAIVFIMCGLIEIISGFVKSKSSATTNRFDFWKFIRQPGTLNILICIAVIALFILFMEQVGFVICTFLLVLALMWRFGIGFLKNIMYSTIFVVAIILIFGKLFTVYLPAGLLEYFGF